MRRRLLIGMAQAVAVGLLVALALALPLIEGLYQREVRARLDSVLTLLEADFDLADEELETYVLARARALSQAGQPVRISVIDAWGNVLSDSGVDGEPEDNHADRPEIEDAWAYGRGYHVRFSDTLRQRYYYAAIRVDDTVIRAALPMQSMASARWMIWGCGLAGALAGALIAMLAARRTAKRVVAPVLELTDAAETIARGDYAKRVAPAGDEVGRLADAFNNMAGQLQHVIGQSQEKGMLLSGVLEGMDDGVLAVDAQGAVLIANDRARKLLADDRLRPGSTLAGSMLAGQLQRRMLTALAKGEVSRGGILTAEATGRILSVYIAPLRAPGAPKSVLAVIADITHVRKLEQLRSDFVANVTHELKTPLTSIRGYTELLKAKQRDPETARAFYDIIDLESERLQTLIEDLLSLSEIENARDEAVACCDASKEARTLQQRFSPIADAAQVALAVEAQPDIRLPMPAGRFAQLLGNLMDNAIKYNVPGGSVRVTLWRERRAACLRVRDTGIGIDAQHHARIFERFYRVDKSRSRAMGGTGLGLSIVKHIVQRYGGDIRMDSRPQEGTTFTVRLPLAPAKDT
nr:ATP-binding protein [Maliibacterium massiliense]